MKVRVLVALAGAWPVREALEARDAWVEHFPDLSKGLRATKVSWDVALVDGAQKSLTLKWAVGELKKRNAAVRVIALGGASELETIAADSPPAAIADLILGAQPKKVRDFEELGARDEWKPLFVVDALRGGVRQWVIGTELGTEYTDRFVALSGSLAGVLPSPALPALLQLGRDETCVYAGFAPLPEGLPLFELNRLLRNERTTLSVGTVAWLGLRICEGLAALHAAHVRHGMIRAAAVWCATDGSVLLRFAALGELVESERLVVYRSMIGTARSHDDISPEQYLSRQPGDLRTDLYQLGYLLYGSLTRASVFDMFPHDRPIRPPIEFVPALPRELSEVVVALLALDPAHRPALSEVQRVLASFACTQEVAAAELLSVRARLDALIK